MEREAREVMSEALAVNAVELEEYSSVTEMTTRCIAMLAHLFNLPPDVAPTGAATVGSTEAAMLALLALKARKRMTRLTLLVPLTHVVTRLQTRWQQRRHQEGKPATKPNLVMGHNAQVALEKFCRCACRGWRAAVRKQCSSSPCLLAAWQLLRGGAPLCGAVGPEPGDDGLGRGGPG